MLVATVTGTVTGGGSSGPVRGRVTSSTYSDLMPPVWGTQALRMVVEWDLTQPSGTALILRNHYVEQDGAGAVYGLGWSDATTNARLTFASAAPMIYPSPMGFGQHYFYTARYADGSTQNVSWDRGGTGGSRRPVNLQDPRRDDRHDHHEVRGLLVPAVDRVSRQVDSDDPAGHDALPADRDAHVAGLRGSGALGKQIDHLAELGGLVGGEGDFERLQAVLARNLDRRVPSD